MIQAEAVFIQRPVLARRLVASWLVVYLVAAGMLWLLSDRAMAYELEADTFGIRTLVESGLPLPKAMEAVAPVVASWRDDSDAWWRGAGAHPAPVMRAAKIRALR